MNISRAIFTGGSRVGKTSLKHYLLYNTAREDKTSTGVLEAPEVATIAGEQDIRTGFEEEEERYQGKEGQVKEDEYDVIKCFAVGSSWKVLTDEKLGQLISKIKMEEREVFPGNTLETPPVSLPQATSNDTSLPDDIAKTTEIASETTKLPTDTSITPPPPPSHDTIEALSVQDPLEVLQQARDSFLLKHNLSTEAEFDEKQCTFIYLLDTGGQPSFQNVLPLLLDFPCNFLHVFKASERLTDPYINAYCKDGVTEVESANSRSTWELMKESITAAYTMSMKSKCQLEAFNVVTEPQLRIFLVGTHLSLLPEDPEAKRALLDHNEKVLEEMDNKPYDSNRVSPPKEVAYKGAGSYFVVDSQLQGDSKLKEHTRKVVNVLRSLLSDAKNRFTLKVPKVWFCLQVITSSVKKKMWKFTEMKEFCIRCNYIQAVDADGQLLALLKLFHSLGFYVYFDLSEYKEQWICTDATFLYKEMSKVLSVQYGPRESSSPELRKFIEKGVIFEAVSEALFRQLGIDADIPTRWLLEVLVSVGIAAKVREKKTHYFIPAVLPERQIHLPEASVATLGFTFSFQSDEYERYSCVPTGLFHRLAVDIASGRQALKEEEVSPVQLRGKQWRYCPSKSDATQFIYSQESGHVILSQKEDLIQLQLLVPQHFPKLGLSLTQLCRHIRREMYERICHVSKVVFGEKFPEEKATLEDGVVCCLKDCVGSSLHLLRFEADSQVTGLCTRLNEIKPLTQRESIWVTKECSDDTSSVSCCATS